LYEHGDYPVTAGVPTMMGQKKKTRLKSHAFFFPGIKFVKSRCLMTYAALETTGRTKSMRSIVAATP
jgi:hypothetical protein